MWTRLLAVLMAVCVFGCARAQQTDQGTLPFTQGAIAANLPTWLPALAQVKAGTGSAVVACGGNSKSEGFTGTRQQSVCHYICAQMVTSGVPCTDQSFFGNGGYGGAMNTSAVGGMGDTITGYTAGHNSQLTWGTIADWQCGSFSNGGTLGGCLLEGFQNTSNMTFAPGGTIDQCDVYHAAGSGNGTISIDFNGGTATTVNDNTTAAVVKTTVNTTAGTSKLLNIHRVSGGSIFVIGAVCRNSTVAHVEMDAIGWGASTTTNQNQTLAPYDVVLALPALQPALTIWIGADTNDYTPSYGPVSLSTYLANQQALFAAAKSTGDVLEVTEIPSAPSRQTYAIQNQYHAVEYQVASQFHAPLFDMTREWWSNYDQPNALGWYADTTHGTAAAYNIEGTLIAKTLLAIQ